MTPLWRRFGAGCHPNRDVRASIERAGLSISRAEPFAALPRLVPVSPMREAVAVRPA